LGAFGEKLRKQREQRGLALDAISNTTKISTRMLRALEDEHFDQLPGGVFNKGFVRAYARQVGLDEEETITDYLAALRESQVQSQKILPDFRTPGGKSSSIAPPDNLVAPATGHVPSGDGKNKEKNKDNGRDLPAAERRRHDERRNEVRRNRDRSQPSQSPLAARPGAGPNEVGRDRHDAHVLEADRQPHLRRQDRPQESKGQPAEEGQHQSFGSLPGFITLPSGAEGSTESADDPSPRISRSMLAVALLLLLTVAGLAAWNSRRHRESVSDFATKPETKPAASSNSASSLPAPTPTTTSATAGSQKLGATSSSSAPLVDKSSAAAKSKSSAPSPAPKPAADSAADPFVAKSTTRTLETKPPATFTLLIRADQTTWVSITADGKPETHETLIAPAHTSVRASRDVTVKVGNAAGVSFQLNGREFPAQGNLGEVRTYTFDATGLRTGP
jgi:cytoskeletal protein RodZ